MAGDARAGVLAQRAADLAAGADIELGDELLLWRLAGDRALGTPKSASDPAWEMATALEPLLDTSQRRRGAHHTPRALAAQVADLALCRIERARQRAAAPASSMASLTAAPVPGRMIERLPQGGARGVGALPVAGRGTERQSRDEASGVGALGAPVGGCGDGRTWPVVVDPTCGAGALLLAAGERLVELGAPRDLVARELLWGADLDPVAVAVTEAAITLWSAGTAPAPGHLVVADTLRRGLAAWPGAPQGFDALVGNPPFQGQLGRDTARSSSETEVLRQRFGPAMAAYVDTAALFLLASLDMVRSGGAVAMIVPQSVVAARDAEPVRRAIAERAQLRALWSPDGDAFDAKVHVCVAALDVGHGEGSADWSGVLASARGVPELDRLGTGSIADLATAIAGFRDEYYGLVGHVREGDPGSTTPLVTSGCIDLGRCTWGERPVRFAKQRWARPEVDLAAVHDADERVAAWLERVRRPKVVVASQTRLVEAAVDLTGDWVPVTPVISVLPHDPDDLWRIAAALCAPPVAVWAARRAAGTALSSSALRMSAPLVLAAPLPTDPDAWATAAGALERHDLGRFADAATAMYRLPQRQATQIRAWWTDRLPR